MYTLASDEKTTLVLAYTHNMLVRGEAVTKDNVRVAVWLRTDGAPNYIHLLNAQVLIFGEVHRSLYLMLNFSTYAGCGSFFTWLRPTMSHWTMPDEKNRSMDNRLVYCLVRLC